MEQIHLLRWFSLFDDKFHSVHLDLADRIRIQVLYNSNTHISWGRDYGDVAFWLTFPQNYWNNLCLRRFLAEKSRQLIEIESINEEVIYEFLYLFRDRRFVSFQKQKHIFKWSFWRKSYLLFNMLNVQEKRVTYIWRKQRWIKYKDLFFNNISGMLQHLLWIIRWFWEDPQLENEKWISSFAPPHSLDLDLFQLVCRSSWKWCQNI